MAMTPLPSSYQYVHRQGCYVPTTTTTTLFISVMPCWNRHCNGYRLRKDFSLGGRKYANWFSAHFVDAHPQLGNIQLPT